ncbi:M48 metallopeptidase family protein [Methylicorpusculum oleiharenae]|uniref:M48 metallopeptidase family protein n=1 Tax=Methylicorpusculum oleiharenae TaxID=1338687 RepID=UPI0022AA45C6|nr:YgjP-like metallopeptidase domain-containing protein [Methylicorpusculum oleiharenae]
MSTTINQQPMKSLSYLGGYPEPVIERVKSLINADQLGEQILKRYPAAHEIRTDKALYQYVMSLKNERLKMSSPLSKVAYDDKISVLNDALGLHTQISRVQGSRLKAKNEIRVAAVFKKMPVEFLRMIVVHELAHLREKDHNKAFYQLCAHMEPDYHQLEFDTRLYLTHVELSGTLY